MGQKKTTVLACCPEIRSHCSVYWKTPKPAGQGGPDKEGWCMVMGWLNAIPCYENVSFCPKCGKELKDGPDEIGETI